MHSRPLTTILVLFLLLSLGSFIPILRDELTPVTTRVRTSLVQSSVLLACVVLEEEKTKTRPPEAILALRIRVSLQVTESLTLTIYFV